MGRAYPNDVEWFRKNMTTSFLCFCTPEDTEDEFILVQNAYGVYEGPEYKGAWLDWHTFAPISHRLIIVLRNIWLERDTPSLLGDSTLSEAQRQAMIKLLTAPFPNEVNARSWLEGLPVAPPTLHHGTLPKTARPVVADPQDNFTFPFYHLSHLYTQRINAIYLEQAIDTDAVVYKSAAGCRRALEWYLRETPDLKSTTTATVGDYDILLQSLDAELAGRLRDEIREELQKLPEYRRKPYLQMLEAIARKLGSSCTATYTTLPASEGPFMQLFARPMVSARSS
jgi:hypothetical protein